MFYLNEFRHFIELPTIPDIIGNILVKENSSSTLWCHSESTSLPPEYRYLSNMEYYWSGVYNGTESNITTALLSREQHRSEIMCTAKEQGTSGLLYVNNSIILNILCKCESYIRNLIYKYKQLMTLFYLV